MQRLCREINDTVQEAGQVSVADLSKNFGLPNKFLVEVIFCVYVVLYVLQYVHKCTNPNIFWILAAILLQDKNPEKASQLSKLELGHNNIY